MNTSKNLPESIVDAIHFGIDGRRTDYLFRETVNKYKLAPKVTPGANLQFYRSL